MKREYGAWFLFILIGVAAWWYGSKYRGSLTVMGAAAPIDNPETTNSGSVVPEFSVSNFEPYNGDEWQTPFYLNNNYPANRDFGSPVVPSLTDASVPINYGLQDLNPQL